MCKYYLCRFILAQLGHSSLLIKYITVIIFVMVRVIST